MPVQYNTGYKIGQALEGVGASLSNTAHTIAQIQQMKQEQALRQQEYDFKQNQFNQLEKEASLKELDALKTGALDAYKNFGPKGLQTYGKINRDRFNATFLNSAKLNGFQVRPGDNDLYWNMLTDPSSIYTAAQKLDLAKRGEIPASDLGSFSKDVGEAGQAFMRIKPEERGEFGSQFQPSPEEQAKLNALEASKIKGYNLDENRDRRVIMNYQQRHQSITADLRKRLNQVSSARELLAGGPISQEAAKTAIARLSGEVGNLTENDINRFGGSSAVTSKISQLFTKAAEGTLTAANRKELNNIVDAFDRGLKTSMDSLTNDIASQGAAVLGISEDEMKNYLVRPKNQQVAVPKETSASQTPSQKELNEALTAVKKQEYLLKQGKISSLPPWVEATKNILRQNGMLK